MQKFLDPNLGKPIDKEFHTYDDNCTISFENVWNEMDHYYQVHWVNYFLAALVLRDALFLHFWSVYDEFIELST